MTTDFFPVNYMAALAFVGADAENFLQGQLTADVAAMPAGQWCRAAYCSPQGRMLAGMMIARRADGYIALLPADMADVVADRLSRFVLRAKVRISRLAAAVDAGAAATEAPPALAGGALRCENDTWFFDEGGGTGLRLTLNATPGADAGAAWRREQIKRGIPWIDAAVSDKFVPQYVNWELLGGVNFQKGCYVGQEIIARLYYLGKVKRRGYVLCGCGRPPAAGDKIGEGAAAVEIINVVGGADEFVALASAPRHMGETLEWDGRTLRLQEPPYGLPTVAEDQKKRPKV